MKPLGEVIVSIVLHPIMLVLAWITSAGRSDLSGGRTVIWESTKKVSAQKLRDKEGGVLRSARLGCSCRGSIGVYLHTYL